MWQKGSKLKRTYVHKALGSVEPLETGFRAFPFAPWKSVVQQVIEIVRAVNRKRKLAGREWVSKEMLRTRRKSVKCLV